MDDLTAVATENMRIPCKLVTHTYPDTDAWCCLWAARRFIFGRDTPCELVFVRSGEKLPDEEYGGYNVIHMDTGGSDTDQHGKALLRESSFNLLCKKYELDKDPGLQAIIELSRATDNVEEVSLTSVHYYFKGLPYFLKEPGTKEVDWPQIYTRVFEVLDIIYSQGVQRQKSQEDLAAHGRMFTLSNKIKVATVWWNARLREAAFAQGADVVMWTEGKGKTSFYVGIQVNRHSTVELGYVMTAIRRAEATKRNISVDEDDLYCFGSLDELPGWFLHDSNKLIVSGSRSHPLAKEEFTRLSPQEILTIIREELSKL